MRLDQAGEVLAKVAPCEGEAAEEEDQRDVEVQVNVQVVADCRGKDWTGVSAMFWYKTPLRVVDRSFRNHVPQGS